MRWPQPIFWRIILPIDFTHKPRKHRWLKLLISSAVIALVLLVVAVVVVRHVYNDNLQPVSQSTEQRTVTILSGTTAHDIALQLKDANLIKQTWVFDWYVRSNNLRDNLQAGTYKFSESQSVNDIVNMIVNGKVTHDLVTILPAQRLDDVKQAFVKSGFTKAEVEAAFNPSLYQGEQALSDKPASASLEGYLYPDSYAKTSATKAEDIVRLALEQMQEVLTPDVRAGFVKQGLTVHEGVILASIVEQEVSNANERPIVAQVFLKRLKVGMALGSDVTARYGAVVDGVTLPSSSVQADSIAIAHDSPYNTRIHAGLPPGPISNVSTSSLQAVASPSGTDYLFFVAGDDGVTHFTQTEAEHEAAIAQYCKKLCSPQ